MDNNHYSKVFGLSLAGSLALMLALNALAQSPSPHAIKHHGPAAHRVGSP